MHEYAKQKSVLLRPKRLGHIVLRVRDLDRSQKFYSGILGLKVMETIPGQMIFMSAAGDSSHELALISVGESALGPDPAQVGLYHFAWEMNTFEDLQAMYFQLRREDIKIAGIGDHGISLGVYIFDPDGNEIELFYELPRKDWPEHHMFEGKFPRKLEDDKTVQSI